MDKAETTGETKTEESSEKLAGKFLSFKLQDETYAVSIEPIEDVIGIKKFTNIPQTASFVRGVINLRGKVIPIVDLRDKFELETREYDKKTCIIIVQLEDILSGFVVDRIREVVELTDEEISPTPPMSSTVKTQYITGMARTSNDQVVILLDIEKIMTSKEMEELKEANESVE